MPLDYKIIGKNIKKRRKEKHVTQQQMADDLFLSLSLISKLERGVKPVSLDTFHAIAEYLNANVEMLLSDPDDPAVQHEQMILDIDEMLEDMDNQHLRIVNQVLKTYCTQIQQLLKEDSASEQPPDTDSASVQAPDAKSVSAQIPDMDSSPVQAPDTKSTSAQTSDMSPPSAQIPDTNSDI